MPLGERLIREITARCCEGRYFDPQGYESLRTVETPEDLRAFLNAQGYGRVTVGASMADVARQLALLKPSVRDVPLVALGIGTAMGLLAFAFAMLLGSVRAQSPQELATHVVQNLAIVAPLLLGFWYGLVQQSLRAMFWGVSVGAVAGGVLRLLCAQEPLPMTLVGALVLCPMMTLSLAPEGRPWHHEALPRFFRGTVVSLGILWIGFLLGDRILMASAVPAVPAPVQPTLTQYQLALWLFATTLSPWAGGVLILFHWATELPHPLRGPCLTLGLSYEKTPGLERVVGKPRQVWQTLCRRLRQEDAAFRRHERRYQFLALVVAGIVLLTGLSPFLMPFTSRWLSPYWAAVAQAWTRAFGLGLGCMILLQYASAARQQFYNARVAQELEKYPEGTTLDEIKAGIAQS